MGQRLSRLSTEENYLTHSWRLKFTRLGCGDELAPCSVLVIGEAKTGKSTLVKNLLRHEDTEERSGQSSTHEADGPLYAVELIDNPVANDSGRGRNEEPLHSRSFRLTYEGPLRGDRDGQFFDLVKENCLRSSYIDSIECFLRKKKIDLVILCLKMSAVRSAWGIPSNVRTSAEFSQIVRKVKRTVVALTFPDCCLAGIGEAHGPSARVVDFNHELEEWKHILHQWDGVNRKIQVFPTSNDPEQLLPNNKPWLSPLVLGIHEMLSRKAVKYLKQHAASYKPNKSLPISDPHPDFQTGASRSAKSASSPEW